MGRTSYSDRLFADGLKKISIDWLKKQGYFKGFKKGVILWQNPYSGTKNRVGIVVVISEQDKYMRLLYKITNEYNEVKEFDYRLSLESTKCYYGGVRYWFTCPLRATEFCNKRVGTLYLVGDYFGCRHCYNLTYQSRNENRYSKYRDMTLIWKLQEKIEELDLNIKRTTYAGRWTKKYSRLQSLRDDLRYAATGGRFI